MNIRKQITEKIINALKKGIVPWRNNHGAYINFLRKEKFNGVNPLLLGLAARKHGFKNKWWGSASQIKTLGFDLKPESHATEIVIYKKGLLGTKLVQAPIYNLDQAVGNHCWVSAKQTPRYNDMERLIKVVDVEFKVAEDLVAWYRYPPLDWIEIPPKEIFLRSNGGINAYYDTIAHELIHWTEAKLGWENDANKYPRAMRELRAEMGSHLLMTELNIPNNPSMLNFRTYVDEWIERMRKDHTLIFKVAVSTCKAVDHLLTLINANVRRFNYIEERAA